MTSRYLSRLRLSHFRNYAAAALDLDSRHVVLVGPNGAGKTNLLEAISMLAPDRGLRRAPLEELAASGGDGAWAVAVTVETPAGAVDIGTGLTPEGRRVRINGAPARSVEQMSEYLRVLWLTPAMDGLFSGPAGERRRFLDRLVMTLIPAHSASLRDYETAMRQRNRLLEESADPTWTAAVEAQMAQHGAAVHFARHDCLTHLDELIARGESGDFPLAAVAMTPLFDRAEPQTAAALETELRATWVEARAQDRAAGRTLCGPHRVDFEVRYAQKRVPAALGSTGEQKALLVGLVLAHARLVERMVGITPLLLLDEVAAHLDPDRRAALFDALERLGTQCFLTGTDRQLFEALGPRAQSIWVRDGRLFPEGR
jgi:DNA replication and repair protein RecF